MHTVAQTSTSFIFSYVIFCFMNLPAFIYPFISWINIWIIFTFWLLEIMLHEHLCINIFGWTCFYFSWVYTSKRIYLFNHLKNCQIVFHSGWAFYIWISSVWGFQLTTFWSTFAIMCPFNYSFLRKWKMLL